MKIKVCSVSLPPSESKATTASQTLSQSARTSSMIWKTFDEQFDLEKGCQNSTSAGIIELDKYMNELLIGRHEDPLTWWNGRKTMYPRLFDIVLEKVIPAIGGDLIQYFRQISEKKKGHGLEICYY